MSKGLFEKRVAGVAVQVKVEISGNLDVSVGTGFLYKASLNDDGEDRSITLLVSNKHVFADPAGKLSFNLNCRDDDGNPLYGRVKSFDSNGFQAAYYEHPDPKVDLACVNVSGVSREQVFYKILDSKFTKNIGHKIIGGGTEVIFPCYPSNGYDVANNRALVKKGVIASSPDSSFNRQDQIFIDAEIVTGCSGSPVFVLANGEYLLLGVVSQTITKHSKPKTLSGVSSKSRSQKTLGGFVIKQKYVKQLLEHAVSEFHKRNPDA